MRYTGKLQCRYRAQSPGRRSRATVSLKRGTVAWACYCAPIWRWARSDFLVPSSLPAGRAETGGKMWIRLPDKPYPNRLPAVFINPSRHVPQIWIGNYLL